MAGRLLVPVADGRLVTFPRLPDNTPFTISFVAQCVNNILRLPGRDLLQQIFSAEAVLTRRKLLKY
jgi:hypothetical protein